MQRTTVYLDAELKRRLKDAAARKGATEASLIREALVRYLARAEAPTLRPVGRSGDGGIAESEEEALREAGFGEE